MISLLRVDEKLLHGAVIFSWINNMKIQSILIADDAIANDKFMQMTFGLSKPSHVELSILSMEDSIQFLQKHTLDALKLMVIVGNIENAAKITQEFSTIRSINIGCLHEFQPGIPVIRGVNLTEEEMNICKELQEKGVQIEFRQTYQDEKIRLGDIR